MAESKRLMRTTGDNKMIAGVCAGVAEYFDIDPVISRVLFVLLALAGGPGLLAYIILWVIMPEKPADGSMPAVEAMDSVEPTE